MPSADARLSVASRRAAARPVPRRVVLRSALVAGVGAGVGAALTGCGLFGGEGLPGGGDPDAVPDTADLLAALADEEDLLDAHRAAVEAHPGLGTRLAGVRADHEEHRRVLRALLADLDPAGGWASPTPSPGTTRATTPADPAEAVAALRAREQESASARTEQAVRSDVRWAPLLGVLAASEAAHAAVLSA